MRGNRSSTRGLEILGNGAGEGGGREEGEVEYERKKNDKQFNLIEFDKLYPAEIMVY